MGYRIYIEHHMLWFLRLTFAIQWNTKENQEKKERWKQGNNLLRHNHRNSINYKKLYLIYSKTNS